MKYSNPTSIQFVTSSKNTLFYLFCIFSLLLPYRELAQNANSVSESNNSIIMGAERTELYFPLLKDKKVAVVTNATGVIRKQNTYVHIIDSMLSAKIQVVKVFAPEHGFRSDADAGQTIHQQIDEKTQLPILSLYGTHKKPTKEDLHQVDIVVFDIQDVGVRFYTYISTLHYVMEACAEQNIPLIVLDRPNPNAHYIDGPVLQPEFKSFVGMHPVPVVYAMTIGEYAQMINGEHWLSGEVNTTLKVIPMRHYSHSSRISLLIQPSPNLPNQKAINLYPSLCFFEGTSVSVGRGTPYPFQTFGSPYLPPTEFEFTPHPSFGAKNPLWNGKKCSGYNLQDTPYLNQLSLHWIIDAYRKYSQPKKFFTKSGRFFDLLAGNSTLRSQIEAGLNEEDIRKSWQNDLKSFKKIRKKYLIYKNETYDYN